MPREALHRFERDGRQFVLDPDTCFCFECDGITGEVLELYPQTPVNRIYHLLQGRHPLKELQEVISELEWLRASKSILTPPTDPLKEWPQEAGLRALFVQFPSPARGARSGVCRLVAPFLLARSQQQEHLRLEIAFDELSGDVGSLGEMVEDGLRLARLAGKDLVVWVETGGHEWKRAPRELQGHNVALRVPLEQAETVRKQLEELVGFRGQSFGSVAKRVQAWPGARAAEIVFRPSTPVFPEAVRAIRESGFSFITLDTDHLYTSGAVSGEQAGLDSIFESIASNARYYVARLLKTDYFRVEPFAGLFLQIHSGTPNLRSDPAGTYALAVDAEGDLYPHRNFIGRPAFRLGSLAESGCDERLQSGFDHVGAMTTAGCAGCWARGLCGGGSVSIHQALTGSYRQPHAEWCQAHRAWIETAIANFNQLSAAGVNFSRLHQHLNQPKRPSLFSLARAAFRMHLGVRPPEEQDAPWLRHWENWNDAAYFTCIETSVLTATQYDREMDALHPRGLDRELILLRRNGTALGLLRLRPERLEGTARIWLYFRGEEDYAVEAYRRSFRNILQEAGGQQGLKRVLCPVGEGEAGLGSFLEGVGFRRVGTEREALYLHGKYQDVHVYGYGFGE